MIAPVRTTPNDSAPATGKPASGRALAADLFAAILGRQAPSVAGNDAADQEAPADGGKTAEGDTLDAVLALIAQAIGAPLSPAATVPAAVPADAAPGTPASSATPLMVECADAAVTPASDGDAPIAAAPAPAALAGDIATLLRRIREWAEAPTTKDDGGSAGRATRTDASATIQPAPSSASIDSLPMFALPVIAQSAPDESADQPLPVESAAKVIERHLDLAKDGQWLDRLARDIAISAGQASHMKFRLNPEHLGSLHVEIAQGAEGATIRLTAETESARAILAGAEPRLAAEARAQGLRIAEARIDLGGQGANGQGGGTQHQARPQVRTANLSEQPLAVVERTVRAAERFA